jgi:Integrase core domain
MKTLKHEEVLAFDYDTMDDLKTRLSRFIDQIYNARRLHSALRYMPPMEFERRNAREGVTSSPADCPAKGVHSSVRNRLSPMSPEQTLNSWLPDQGSNLGPAD